MAGEQTPPQHNQLIGYDPLEFAQKVASGSIKVPGFTAPDAVQSPPQSVGDFIATTPEQISAALNHENIFASGSTQRAPMGPRPTYPRSAPGEPRRRERRPLTQDEVVEIVNQQRAREARDRRDNGRVGKYVFGAVALAAVGLGTVIYTGLASAKQGPNTAANEAANSPTPLPSPDISTSLVVSSSASSSASTSEVPSTLASTSSSATPSSSSAEPTSSAPKHRPSPRILPAANHWFEPAALAPLGGCTDVEATVVNMTNRVTLNYVYQKTTTTTPSPRPSSSKTPAPTETTTNIPVQISEGVHYSGQLAIKICANDVAVESVNKQSGTPKIQEVDIDQSKYSVVVDPSGMQFGQDLVAMDKATRTKLIAAFQRNGITLTHDDLVRLSNFAKSKGGALENFSLQALTHKLDLGVDLSNNSTTFVSEMENWTQATITPIVRHQLVEQKIPSYNAGNYRCTSMIYPH